MFSQASVILSTISLMATRSLLILATVRSVRILLECFLVTIPLSRYILLGIKTFAPIDRNMGELLMSVIWVDSDGRQHPKKAYIDVLCP